MYLQLKDSGREGLEFGKGKYNLCKGQPPWNIYWAHLQTMSFTASEIKCSCFEPIKTQTAMHEQYSYTSKGELINRKECI